MSKSGTVRLKALGAPFRGTLCVWICFHSLGAGLSGLEGISLHTSLRSAKQWRQVYGARTSWSGVAIRIDRSGRQWCREFLAWGGIYGGRRWSTRLGTHEMFLWPLLATEPLIGSPAVATYSLHPFSCSQKSCLHTVKRTGGPYTQVCLRKASLHIRVLAIVAETRHWSIVPWVQVRFKKVRMAESP